MMTANRNDRAADSARVPSSSAPPSRFGTRFVLLSVGAALSLAAVGFWTYHAVMEGLYDVSAEALTTVLRADVTALGLWVENEKSVVESWSKDADVRHAIAELATVSSEVMEPREVLLASPHLAELRQVLQSVMTAGEHQGFVVLGRSGVVLAALRDGIVGLRLSEVGMALAERVFRGETFLSKPFLEQEMFADYEGAPAPPWMATAAPVYDRHGRIVAGLFFGIWPEQEFSRILSAARIGKSGDTYAFDERGIMLSDSRHDDQLKAIGVLPDTPESRSILRVHLRDPGGDLTRGFQPDTPVDARSLTKLVASAVSGEKGMHTILEPYRDYRGVPVIGAYWWAPEQGIGIATEAEVAELLRIIRPLRLAFYGLFGVILVSAAAIVVTSLVNQRLRQRVREVQQLGQYKLTKKIGEGGMGKVYLARHAMLRRPTAVKFLDPERVTPETVARFEREVQLTSRLTHPNTVEVYDYGRTPEGIFYYAMEYIPGISLAQLIAMEGAVPPDRVIHILRQVCLSLQEAHALGLIHRDIKPLNVMLCEQGGQADVVKVLDFGLVKDVSKADPEELQITSAQVIPGTPAYVAPERLRDPLNIDARADIYCVGAVGFNLLTGRDVFEGTSAVDISVQVLQSPPPRPSDVAEEAIPSTLDQLIVDCLAKDPADRPQSVAQIIETLEGIEEIEPWTQEKARHWWQTHAGDLQDLAEIDAVAVTAETNGSRAPRHFFRGPS